MLIYDPDERITAQQALKHEYFRDLYEIDSLKKFQKSLYKLTPYYDLYTKSHEEDWWRFREDHE